MTSPPFTRLLVLVVVLAAMAVFAVQVGAGASSQGSSVDQARPRPFYECNTAVCP